METSRPLSVEAAAVPPRVIALPDLGATERLAAMLAGIIRRGDVIALEGPLGAGKTAFARAFIRVLGGGEEVPSPTFTLVQVYDLAPAPVWHFDLYRIGKPGEIYELGIEEGLAEGICLIEWPGRLGPLLPAERLDLRLDFADEATARQARLTGHGAWASRLEGLGPLKSKKT
jgi:tRNA threonylcarbamoyladenosine biosynthesis protein TsaE